jgi:hypothetical protein
LLGDPDRVDRELDREREVPPVYDENDERPSFPETEVGALFRQAPITERQLLGIRHHRTEVLVVLGNAASGVKSLAEFLRLDSPESTTVVDPRVRSRKEFEEWFTDLRNRKRQSDVSSNVVVDCSLEWDQSWVEGMTNKLARYTADEQTRCIFIADRSRLEPDDYFLVQTLPAVRTEQLRPLKDQALRTWLQFKEHPVKVEERRQLREHLGAWPQFLEEFDAYRRTTGGPWKKCLQDFVTEEFGRKPSLRLDQLGVTADDIRFLRPLKVPSADLPSADGIAEELGLPLEEVVLRLTFLEHLWVVRRVIEGKVWRLALPVPFLLGRLEETA